MNHFKIDTRDLSKKQFKALRAAAKAAGMDVTRCRWSDQAGYPIMITARMGEPGLDLLMCMVRVGHPCEDVTYPEAMRRLADAAESPAHPSAPMTPAQEAGFEVGDKAVVIEEGGGFVVGSIVRLHKDDDSDIPEWGLIDGRHRNGACHAGATGYVHLSRVRKLTNI